MEIKINIKKSVDENANDYFQKAKIARRKLKGVEDAILKTEQLKQESDAHLEKRKEMKQKVKRKEKWFEKFHFCYSSDGFLMIGGKDATSNEIVVKKHAEKVDLISHTSTPGSPFIIIKNPDKKEIPIETRREAAQMCAVFSKAWKRGLGSMDCFVVKPEQVTKETKSGEFMGKGSFMIYGERENFSVELKLGIGLIEIDEDVKTVITGPYDAILKNCESVFEITKGNSKVSDLAKNFQKLYKVNTDEIIRRIPSGSSLTKKEIDRLKKTIKLNNKFIEKKEVEKKDE
jgi:hypothetical protein